MHFSKLLLGVSLAISTIANSQIGTEFWFAAPDISQTHASNSVPLMLHITALHNTHVVISRPADLSFTPVEFDLGSQQTQSIRMDANAAFNNLHFSSIETYARNPSVGNFIQDKGFLITAFPGEITAYYEPSALPNSDIVALKAANALGKDFWVSTQRKYKNYPYSDDYSGFTIVATKDGTVVNIDPKGNNLKFLGTATLSRTLNKGQSIAIRALGQAAAQHIHGIKVTSSENISIIIYDDSMIIDDGVNSSWDIFADQIVPTSVVGREYIVLQGWVQDKPAVAEDGEAIFITPTQDNTDIYIDGVFVAGPLSAGDYFQYEITKLSTHVKATHPIYVNHISGYSTNASISSAARELGGAILPPIDNCTGSHSVTVKRTPATGFVFFNNLMVRNDTAIGSATRNQAINNFTYSINNGTPVQIPPSHFTYIMDSAFAFYDRTKAGGAAYYNNVIDGQLLRVDNPTSRFHLGVMQAKQSPGCKYGYFSDFAASDPAAGLGGFTQGNSDVYCNLNPIQMVAGGGTSYKWDAPNDPTLINKIDYDSVADPYFFPDTTGVYEFNVEITGQCYAKVTLPIRIIVVSNPAASFAFSADEGCSPFAPIIMNQSDTIEGGTQLWTIKPAVGSSYQISHDSVPMTFNLLFPENHTDAIQKHTVELIVKGPSNSCPSTRTKDFNVKPQIEAKFSASDTIGCHPLFVNFYDSSSGNLDTNSYYWDFGDNTQSFDTMPSKNYVNYTQYDTNLTVVLITESPFGCKDTASQNITIHPRIRVNLAVDNTSSCSPIVSKLNPTSSVGVDTLKWNIDYFYADSTYIDTNVSIVNLVHYDTSTAAGPDTLFVQIIGVNRMGCTDTSSIRRLIVYPDVISDFTVTESVVCDSVPITFTNNSFGYKLNYEWDFGNNTYSQDSVGKSYTKAFYNRTNKDTVYNVQLRATSAYFCEDIMDTNITVHPYIKADFGMNYDNNCSPLLTEITNTSVRALVNNWDFGTGSTVINNSPSFSKNFDNPYSNKDTTILIKLVVRNPEMCFDSISRNLLLFPQVVANFDFTTDSIGCAPLNIGLQNNSTGGSLTYTWDYGNNSSSTKSDTNFTKIFNNVTSKDTTYIIELIARNLQGCDSIVSRPVEVFAFVDAEFNLPVVDSCSPFTIRADNLSSEGALVFDWEIDNTNISSDFEPVFAPFLAQDDTVRNYLVRLTAAGAIDPAHMKCADKDSVIVTVYPELEADIDMDVTTSCQPLISPIRNETNIISGTSFTWYIDNKFYSSASVPPALEQNNFRNYDTSFTINLYGRSQYGCRDTATQDITVYSMVDAFFTLAPSAICSGDSFQIDQTYTNGGIVSTLWDFNSEATSNTTANRFYYADFENTSAAKVDKLITLTVANSHGCDSTWRDTITVYPKVIADFPAPSPVCYPDSIYFVNNSINANQAYWVFGDGSSSIDTEPIHQYNNFDRKLNKTFNVKLTSTSEYSCFDTITKQVTIYAKPKANFILPTTVDCPPFNVTVKNYSQGASLTYKWDFAGESYTSEEPSHTFTNNGNTIDDRVITLTVESDMNCTDFLSKPVSIYPNVDVDFAYSIDKGCSPLEVNFTGKDTSNVLQMLWSIDGSAFSTIIDPTYRFINETPGNKVHDIKFQAYSLYDCSADTTKQITVYPSPIAEFIPRPLPVDYGTEADQTPITFSNETVFSDSWSYEWDYGDGNTNSEVSRVFEYVYGSYFWGQKSNGFKVPVVMRAWNADNPECRDSVSHDVIIYPPIPEVDLAEDISGCEPFTVDFNATTKYINEDDYLWEFGIIGDTSVEAAPTHTYEKPGTYTVKLVVKGEGGTNWDYKIVRVNPKPIAAFAFNDSVVFDSSQTKGYDWINFYNQTKFADKFYWYFDTENDFYGIADSEERDPSWFYTEVGKYYVGLIAESGDGCSDTLTYPNPITVLSEGFVQFPTAFLVSPDGAADETIGENEINKYVFYPLSSGVEEYRIEIYNRWGVRVFESRSIKQGWNGYFDGKPAKQDVYIYRARGIYTNGQAFDTSGDVTLIHGKDEVSQE